MPPAHANHGEGKGPMSSSSIGAFKKAAELAILYALSSPVVPLGALAFTAALVAVQAVRSLGSQHRTPPTVKTLPAAERRLSRPPSRPPQPKHPVYPTLDMEADLPNGYHAHFTLSDDGW